MGALPLWGKTPRLTWQNLEAQLKAAGNAGAILRPVNVASKRLYQGVNILSLWAAGDEAGYESGTWGTYKQWAEAEERHRAAKRALGAFP
jgi:antirestriction protein ArdC